jgi:AraC-like DNA-binding protein
VILTRLPDLSPRNADFRREFYRRWGRENCVVSGKAQRAEYGLFRQTLSIKCVARGTEHYFLERRRITVSDDTYLVLNEGRIYASLLDAPAEAYSFSIFFRPGLAREVARDLGRTAAQALDDDPAAVCYGIEFAETLRPHDAGITPVLRFIQRHVAAGMRDENWLEEQCQFLVARLLRTRTGARQPCAGPVADARPARRAELARRIELATDFMHAHLGASITLADIAAAARLSRFHFLRLFNAMHGCTPFEHLRALRTRRALALLESTTFDAGEIAAQVGMSRVALWRNLRHASGAGVRRMRREGSAGAPAAFLPHESRSSN